jgi:thiamine pyrophosphokinase
LGPTRPRVRLGLMRGTLLSVFAWSPQVTGLTLRGVEYPLRDFDLRQTAQASLGLSNRTTEESCAIQIKSGKLLVIVPRNWR